ncbi:MAG: hypothetical protein DRR16_00400 [Candidatus Parabeggiatoa sp. nov. 3]|jgi:flagellar biosynthesis/type III secretory pathway M-ring protein FliF/YscJ|nr:MAG: hypothetical protein DRR00_01475 [Gammaproteobacteria bacterium]RKZ66248.1 MAG: hypothetical protein DRQ99_10295 [Gammaproteobacteria bacterium]RKZ90161.1 MAG: hypothetical protein DRR16_00400 [Gammaproteobacteria bacterium]
MPSRKNLQQEEVWYKISQSSENIDVPQWQKKELDKRLSEHRSHPNEATPYHEFHVELRESL